MPVAWTGSGGGRQESGDGKWNPLIQRVCKQRKEGNMGTAGGSARGVCACMCAGALQWEALDAREAAVLGRVRQVTKKAGQNAAEGEDGETARERRPDRLFL